MKQKQAYRTAILALSASIALPTAPVFGQDASAPPVLITPPSPVTTASPPPRIVVTPPTAQQPASSPAPRVALPPVPEVRAPAPEASSAAARTTRAAPRAAPAAPPAESAAPAPEAAPPPTTVEPTPVAPVSALSSATGATGEAAEPAAGPSLFWLIVGLAGLAVVALITFLALRRRRPDEEVHYQAPALVEDPAPVAVAPAPELADYQEPLIAPVPTFAREPASAPAREVPAPTVSAADEGDVAALAASSDAGGERPWLEFLLRPVRAGTSSDETIVQYDLTIANTGGRDARDVRVTSWLFPAGTSEMEQSLIGAPAEARAAEADIAAGEGVRIEGEASLARSGLSDETVLPVLVAEARYRLPDGGAGRTRAAFEIGMAANGEIAPFPLDRATGLVEFVEARLHGEPERV